MSSRTTFTHTLFRQSRKQISFCKSLVHLEPSGEKKVIKWTYFLNLCEEKTRARCILDIQIDKYIDDNYNRCTDS